ncbi:TadE/TadG family type IV pilus assembly protein [Streptomyces sp. NPDC057620]|uniref:TadE/TadG family type IV pilus assembly protein n=1 Tax=Streptomyces sp. NPDC057620 TaxID=3346185 RepID=UPI0036CD93E9
MDSRSQDHKPPPGRLRRRIGLTADRGVGSVEVAVLALVVLALAFTTIQVGLYYHARKVAQSAARHGVDDGRQFGAGPGSAALQAREYLERYGDSVRDAQVDADGSSAEQIRITVTGEVATLLPGLTLHVTQHADGPVERWTTP